MKIFMTIKFAVISLHCSLLDIRYLSNLENIHLLDI